MPLQKAIAMGLLWVFALLLASCTPEEPIAFEGRSNYPLEIPPGIPEMPLPDHYLMTRQTVGLGRQLFFDPVLSRDGTVSCATCHHQEIAFADFDALSEGAEGRKGFRNAPGLFNLAWHGFFNKDGGTPTLELQMLVPISDHAEMDFSIRELVERLNQHPTYPQAFEAAFGSPKVSHYTLTAALGAYERSLVSFNSPYDRWLYHGEEDALDASQKRGRDLFFSEKTNCGSCHGNFDFRKEGFENNGLYEYYADSGRARVTLRADDNGKFKVPSLRNAALTAPYMHDGSIATLSEVVDHYASGGSEHPNKSPFVSGFQLSPDEKQDLLNFIESLTDPVFTSNPEYQPR